MAIRALKTASGSRETYSDLQYLCRVPPRLSVQFDTAYSKLNLRNCRAPLFSSRLLFTSAMSASEGQDSNPFLNEEEQTPFQEEAIDSPPAPASIPLPSSFSAEAYPQDDPPAAFTASVPSTSAADARNRSASVASSVKPPKDAIQVSDDVELLASREGAGKTEQAMDRVEHYQRLYCSSVGSCRTAGTARP